MEFISAYGVLIYKALSAVLLIVLMVIWVFVPFAIFGIKRALLQLVLEQQKTRDVLVMTLNHNFARNGVGDEPRDAA